MSKARLVITAVVLDGRSQSEVARAYGVSQPWVSRLVARWRVEGEGEAAFEPRSRRPHVSPAATSPEVVALVLTLRKELKILNFLDDHSRCLLACTTHSRISGPIVVATFRQAVDQHGIPASVLSDNGMVFTTRSAGGTGGRNAFQHELARLGVVQKNSAPAHPQTCGKIERLHQTLRKWLARQPAATLTDLQAQLDAFREHDNTARTHRALGRSSPAAAYVTRPKATPNSATAPTHDRVRRDVIDPTGKVTLRYNSRLYKIGVGRTHARTHVLLLVQDPHIRVIHATTGELLRELTLNPSNEYQPTGRPPGPKHTRSEPKRGFGPMPMS